VENSLVEKTGLLSLEKLDFIIIFIQLLYKYYTNIIQILYKYYTNIIKLYNKINTNYNNEQQML
jgi:hypothetical protein